MAAGNVRKGKMKKTDILKSYKERKLLRLKQSRHQESLLQDKINGITNMAKGLGMIIQQLEESLGWINETQFKS